MRLTHLSLQGLGSRTSSAALVPSSFAADGLQTIEDVEDAYCAAATLIECFSLSSAGKVHGLGACSATKGWLSQLVRFASSVTLKAKSWDIRRRL